MDGQGIDSRLVQDVFFFLLQDFRTGSGAHPASYSLGVKRPGRESDHSPPTSAVVKNYRSCTSTPLYAFTALTGTILPFCRLRINTRHFAERN